MTTQPDPEWIAKATADALRDDARAAILRAKDSTLPYPTALIMAGDLRTADEAMEALVGGLPAEDAIVRVGSYGRIAFLVRAEAEGFLTRSRLLDLLIEHWTGSDPDDTDRRLLALWKEARQRAGAIIMDKPQDDASARWTIMSFSRGWVRVYRGQRPKDPIGFAWTTNRDIAAKFARGAGYRIPIDDGTVLTRYVRPRDVLAYLTSRGEYEVIVDPRKLRTA